MPEYQKSDKERIAILETNYANLVEVVKTLVTQDQFQSVKLIAYGAVGIITTSVLISIMGHFLVK
jgi:hypothetical protein